jgi:SAM-dependent methyltransferase
MTGPRSVLFLGEALLLMKTVVARIRRRRTMFMRSEFVAGSIGAAALSASLFSLAAVLAAGQQAPPRVPDIYFAPTAYSVADAMLKLARVRPGDVVYDLGSGDGRIVILAAQKYGARGVGIELQPRLVEISRQVAREGAVADRVTFIEGDLFTADISEATVVTLYLSRTVNMQLEPKLKRELRPGTRIVSHQFPIGYWRPDESLRVEDEELLLWTIPAR